MNNRYSYNKNTDKTVWIDFDNSPHVPFFAPIIYKLQENGFTVKLTNRKYAQTVGLTKLYGLDAKTLGKHYGKNKFLKVIGTFYRSLQLLPFALKNKPILAISHGSRSQMVLAHFLKIPIILFLDYEYVQTLPFVKPRLGFFPSVVSEETLSKFQFETKTYPGIKEYIYVPSFIPDKSIKEEYNFDNCIVIIIRPPAHEAHYHTDESQKLFEKVLEKIIKTENTKSIILPRDKKQKNQIIGKYKKYFDNEKFIIPTHVVDALSLMWFADIVISGGGTMNREAAALGIPVYSIFKGKIGDVDKYLSQANKLTIISSSEELESKFKVEKRKSPQKLENINSITLQSIVNDLNNLVLQIDNSNSVIKTSNTDDKIVERTQPKYK